MQDRPKSEPLDAGDTLSVSVETVCFLIVKAREFDAKEEANEADPGSNPADDREISVLEDRADDPVVEEFTAAVQALSEDKQIDLVALAWLGRGDGTLDDWASLREQAAAEYNNRTASYLLGMPLLADFLEEGLSILGRSCEEFEVDHL